MFLAFTVPVLAASDHDKTKLRHVPRTASHSTSGNMSCSAHLTLMVRSSSFAVTDKLRTTLQLRVERDDGDHILLMAYKGGASPTQLSTGQTSPALMGWLLYHPASQQLRDVSENIENENLDIDLITQTGRPLKLDRRYAYLFDKCRRRHNLKQEITCQFNHQKTRVSDFSPIQARSRSVSTAVLYSAPDLACPIYDEVALKAGSSLEILSQTDGFYFVRQGNFKKDFITGWILQDRLENAQILNPLTPVQPEAVETPPVGMAIQPKVKPKKTTVVTKVEVTKQDEEAKQEGHVQLPIKAKSDLLSVREQIEKKGTSTPARRSLRAKNRRDS